MTYGGNDFNYFPENQLTKFKLCSPTSLFFLPLRISVTHFASLGGASGRPCPFPFSTPLPFLSTLTQLGDLKERCKLHRRVRAEPGYQTHFGAFRGKMKRFRDRFLAFLRDRT